MRVLSPRIEPPLRVEDGSTASTATRCPAEVRFAAELIDEGRFADARHAGEADARGRPGFADQLRDQRARLAPMVGAHRFDERDGARERGAVAGAQARREIEMSRAELGHVAD